MHRFYYFIISACMLFTSCNKDEVITEEVGGQPIIELDSETGIYTVKVDHELTIAPTYQNVEDALFAWTIDGTLVSSGPVSNVSFFWVTQDIFPQASHSLLLAGTGSASSRTASDVGTAVSSNGSSS